MNQGAGEAGGCEMLLKNRFVFVSISLIGIQCFVSSSCTHGSGKLLLLLPAAMEDLYFDERKF